MNEKDKVKVLALMEAYRLKIEYSPDSNNADYAIRVCQAIIANLFGYKSRADWTDDIKAAGLIDYEYHDGDEHYERYKALTEIVNAIRI